MRLGRRICSFCRPQRVKTTGSAALRNHSSRGCPAALYREQPGHLFACNTGGGDTVRGQQAWGCPCAPQGCCPVTCRQSCCASASPQQVHISFRRHNRLRHLPSHGSRCQLRCCGKTGLLPSVLARLWKHAGVMGKLPLPALPKHQLLT